MENICENPDLLSAMLIVNRLILIIKVLVPLFLIIKTIIHLSKTITENDNYKEAIDLSIKRFFVAAFVFFIPSFVKVVISYIPGNIDYEACFDNATVEKIDALLEIAAVNAVTKLEENYLESDYEDAIYAVNRLKNGTTKDDLIKRLDSAKIFVNSELARKIKQIYGNNSSNNNSSNNTLSPNGGLSSAGNGKCQTGIVYSSEPDPSIPIDCNSQYINSNDFTYPKDSATGLPLGAWPPNYESIPTQLEDYEEHSAFFVFPTNPLNGKYNFVYDHLGMDIMANFGTPVYSPVDGVMIYSEWGHTPNKGWDETSYTVSIRMSNPTRINKTNIDTIFMTHLSGIVSRCPYGTCNKPVKQGELIGFVGNAASTSADEGWAPHLHITLYGDSNYDGGLWTNATEIVFDIPANATDYSIMAGE